MFSEDQIINYIELVRSCVPNAVDVFTKGNCGCFARMLNITFPGGQILNLTLGHRVFEYKGNCYDITGNITDQYNWKKAVPLKEYDLEQAISLLKPRYKI